MKFNSEKSIDILKYALEKEKAAEDFYTDKMQTLDVPAAKVIFKGLASDEHQHFQIVSDLIKQAESDSGIKPVILHPSSSPKDRIETVFGKFKDGHLPSLSAKTTAMEALSFALEMEKQSFNYYSQAAEDAGNSEVAAVYRFLAGEENKHYIMIDNTIDFIDVPSRWLYEEENLIFRL